MKGVFDGNCNRTACQKPIKDNNWWNSSTRAYYCETCANGHHGINYWSKRDDGVIICTKVTSPDDKPAFPYTEIQAHRKNRHVVIVRDMAAPAGYAGLSDDEHEACMDEAFPDDY